MICVLRKSNPDDLSKEILGFKSASIGIATYLVTNSSISGNTHCLEDRTENLTSLLAALGIET